MQEFMKCNLEHYKNDPDEWLMKLETLKWNLKSHGHEIKEEDMMVHILHNLPVEYKNTIEIIEIELESEFLDLHKIREKLRNNFSRF